MGPLVWALVAPPGLVRYRGSLEVFFSSPTPKATGQNISTKLDPKVKLQFAEINCWHSVMNSDMI
jgi:hypothetical protein